MKYQVILKFYCDLSNPLKISQQPTFGSTLRLRTTDLQAGYLQTN